MLLESWPLAKHITLWPFPRTSLIDNPPLKRCSADVIDLACRHDLEHGCQGRIRKADGSLLFRFDNEQMRSVKTARGLDIYTVASPFSVCHGYGTPAHFVHSIARRRIKGEIQRGWPALPDGSCSFLFKYLSEWPHTFQDQTKAVMPPTISL